MSLLGAGRGMLRPASAGDGFAVRAETRDLVAAIYLLIRCTEYRIQIPRAIEIDGARREARRLNGFPDRVATAHRYRNQIIAQVTARSRWRRWRHRRRRSGECRKPEKRSRGATGSRNRLRGRVQRKRAARQLNRNYRRRRCGRRSRRRGRRGLVAALTARLRALGLRLALAWLTLALILIFVLRGLPALLRRLSALLRRLSATSRCRCRLATVIFFTAARGGRRTYGGCKGTDRGRSRHQRSGSQQRYAVAAGRGSVCSRSGCGQWPADVDVADLRAVAAGPLIRSSGCARDGQQRRTPFHTAVFRQCGHRVWLCAGVCLQRLYAGGRRVIHATQTPDVR